MIWQNLEVMPCVTEIIQAAEVKIKELTGKAICLLLSEDVPDKKAFEKEKLQELVCNYFNTTWSVIKSTSRKANVVAARHTYFYLAIQELKISQQEAAEDCGCSNHTSAGHAHRKMTEQASISSPDFAPVIEIKKLMQ